MGVIVKTGVYHVTDRHMGDMVQSNCTHTILNKNSFHEEKNVKNVVQTSVMFLNDN